MSSRLADDPHPPRTIVSRRTIDGFCRSFAAPRRLQLRPKSIPPIGRLHRSFDSMSQRTFFSGILATASRRTSATQQTRKTSPSSLRTSPRFSVTFYSRAAVEMSSSYFREAVATSKDNTSHHCPVPRPFLSTPMSPLPLVSITEASTLY